MTLGERIEELLRTRRIVPPVNLPQKLALEKSFELIDEKYGHPGGIHASDYQSLLIKLQAVARVGSFSTLSLREMRLAAGCLFDGQQPIANDERLLDQFLDSLRSIQSRLAIKRLIHSYCTNFDPNHAGIVRIGAFLRESVPTIRAQWEWPQRHRQYMIFDASRAPHELAKLTIDSVDPRRVLANVGLRGHLLAGGLSVHVFVAAMKRIQDRLESQPQLEDIERAIAWVRTDGGETHFSAYRAELANALLLPWTRHDPPDEIRQTTQNYLLDVLGDPRIEHGAWLRADESARDVFIRWLAQATLEQFLKVVDRLALRHQWDYRRVFWNAYIEKGAVANAWVAFGSSGAQVANQIAKNTADKLMLRFGTLAGGGADQAVLLLNIGGLVIADWSHNGKLRIWRRGNKRAPQFNLSSYVAADLRAHPDFETVHLPPDGWQMRTEAHIRRHTGIRLNEAEYMPRRKPR
jgi:hypothetical protein